MNKDKIKRTRLKRLIRARVNVDDAHMEITWIKREYESYSCFLLRKTIDQIGRTSKMTIYSQSNMSIYSF